MLPMQIATEISDDSDRIFLGALYDKYKRVLLSQARKSGLNEFDAEDIVNDAFVNFSGMITKLRELEDRKLVNYMITAVRNIAYNHCKKQANKRLLSLDDPDFDYYNRVGNENDMDQRLITIENQEEFAKAFSMLDDDSRYLLTARYILDEGDDEIALAFNVKSSSIRMMMTRARKKLLKTMKELENIIG